MSRAPYSTATSLGLRVEKETPSEPSKNAQLLLRGNLVRREMAGVYSLLPLGLRAARKIEAIVRQEMEQMGGVEVRLPSINDAKQWEKTGRAGVDVAFEVGKNGLLCWSHEEVITPMARDLCRSHKDFPKMFFQIAPKFRQEPRAKSGLLRGREFIMKDAYSFHLSGAELDAYYEQMAAAYLRIFGRMGLEAFRIQSGGGDFTDKHSDEFVVQTPAGEDEMLFCPESGFAVNVEVAGELREGSPDPRGSGAALRRATCVEVGNIFRLGTKFADDFGFAVPGPAGATLPVHMGCYGIGITRLLGTVAEVFGTEDGLRWPRALAPFAVQVVALPGAENEGQALAQALADAGVETLLDDRDAPAGKKLGDADFLGFPTRVVVSRKTLENGKQCEVLHRESGETQVVGVGEVAGVVVG